MIQKPKMRFLRTFPRKVWRLLLYVAIGGLIVFCFPLIKSFTEPLKEIRSDGKVKRSLDQGHDETDAIWPYGKDTAKKDWHDYEQIKQEADRTGPGEQGSAIKVPQDEETKSKQDQMYRVNGYDAYASDMISLNRSVKVL